MAEREKHQRHHNPNEGETRFPATEGEQHGPHEPGERDPHEPLNRPESDTPDVIPGKAPEPDGMGGRPPARGERRASRPMPETDD